MIWVPTHKTEHQHLSWRTGSLLKNNIFKVCALPVGPCFQEVHTSRLPATVNNKIEALLGNMDLPVRQPFGMLHCSGQLINEIKCLEGIFYGFSCPCTSEDPVNRRMWCTGQHLLAIWFTLRFYGYCHLKGGDTIYHHRFIQMSNLTQCLYELGPHKPIKALIAH